MTPVTAIVVNGGLTPSVLSTMEEWLAFNAFIRRAVERRGRLSLTPRGGLERGGDGLPARGRFATLEQGGDAGRSRGSRWEPSSEAEMVPWARKGGEWAVCWASLSSLLSFRSEGGRGPSWAQLP